MWADTTGLLPVVMVTPASVQDRAGGRIVLARPAAGLRTAGLVRADGGYANSVDSTPRGRWAAIAPEPAGHVAAVGFDPDSGRLIVCPESTGCATKARLEQTRLIAAANEAAGRAVVRALRILPPGTVPAPDSADAPTGPAAGRPIDEFRVVRRSQPGPPAD
ncbi:DciA family protein [Streptomyces sp. NPDC004609]|uniref:DciA family protein n=1 Tax=Streptomyces sp. NPDC004609 TaxID=3364704 RepID=UPI0036A32100